MAATTLARSSARGARAQESGGETFVIGATRPPTDLDPHSSYDAGSGVVLPGPYEGLIRMTAGETGTYEGAIAESWEANADRSVWTFRIRDGVTFHDGSVCDAEAVRASFERLMTLKLPASSVLGRFLPDPAQVGVSDPRTVVFELGRPQPMFEAAIASPYGTAILNTALARQHEADGDWGHAWAQLNAEGLGTGPYRLDGFEPEERAELVRYDGYWRGWEGDHFDRIVVRVVPEAETRRELIEQGDADLVDTLPPEAVLDLEANTEVVVDRRYTYRVTYLITTVAGLLASPAARQAMCWAFPYDEVIDGVYEGQARRAIGPVAELCRGFDAGTFLYSTDLLKARQLLDQAGIGESTSLRMMVPNTNPLASSIAQLFAANLAQIGVGLEIETAALGVFAAMLYGEMPAEERPNLFPFFWSPDYDDAWNHLWPQLSCDAWQGGNVGHYCNSQVEELLGQARDASDEVAYQAALSEVQQIVTRDDPAAVYFAQAQWSTVLRRDVAGYASHPILPDILDFYRLYRSG
jgi:peptide/nickel transport system substrate-binding protein